MLQASVCSAIRLDCNVRGSWHPIRPAVCYRMVQRRSLGRKPPMQPSRSRVLWLAITIASLILAVVAFAANSNGLAVGKADLKSAGPLAFGPGGILFVGDSLQASIFAIDTEDNKAS